MRLEIFNGSTDLRQFYRVKVMLKIEFTSKGHSDEEANHQGIEMIFLLKEQIIKIHLDPFFRLILAQNHARFYCLPSDIRLKAS